MRKEIAHVVCIFEPLGWPEGALLTHLAFTSFTVCRYQHIAGLSTSSQPEPSPMLSPSPHIWAIVAVIAEETPHDCDNQQRSTQSSFYANRLARREGTRNQFFGTSHESHWVFKGGQRGMGVASEPRYAATPLLKSAGVSLPLNPRLVHSRRMTRYTFHSFCFVLTLRGRRA